MKPFRWCFSRLYWEDISVERSSYLSRVIAIGAAVIALVLFVALFYDPAEAHRSHAPEGYAIVQAFSAALLLTCLSLPALVSLMLPLLGEAFSGLTSSVIRI